MKTKSKKVETFEVRAFCEQCEEELIYQNFCYSTYPHRYVHECKNGHKEDFLKTYPSLEYRYII
jgi:hypothetical protein